MDIESIIAKMTLEDKIKLCEGKNFWETQEFEKYGIPSMFMCDGPHGLRKQDMSGATDMLGINESLPATCFPAEVTSSASWDPELLSEVGKAIAEEAKALNVGLVLGPGANIKRNPRCGRNFEYFSEDPLLAGELAAGFIKGLEGQGIGTSLKHFACNSQELGRLTSDGLLDERTLREIYLTQFEIAVKKAKPSTLMCSYPKVNGIHASDNKKLLTDILRTEWGYDGMVVTDWGAMNDKVEAFKAGCDLNMPGGSGYMSDAVKKAVEDGKLSIEDVDNSVRRILKLVFRAQETLSKETQSNNKDAHHILARKVAERGAVLLKNEDGILPMNLQDAKIAVVGSMAKNLRIQGAGSSHINPTKTEQFMDYLPNAVYAQGCLDDGSTTDELLSEVEKAAFNADRVIVFAGLPGSYESEGFDRDNLKMPDGHLRMISAAVKMNRNVIVVLVCGSAVECPWADDVKAILYMGLPGQGGACAIYNLLSGIVNPCGKLSESWPYSYDDVPSSEIFCEMKDALYEEGIYIGYRYYEKASIKTRFLFGYGLSYTSFEYSDLETTKDQIKVRVKNTGAVKGAETVQVYVGRNQCGIHRPVRELKAFAKVELDPGEDKIVTIDLNERAFSVWADGWKTEKGDYTVFVGNLSSTVTLDGETIDAKDESSWYWTLSGKPNREDFEKALGRKYVEKTARKGEYNMESTVADMAKTSLVMKALYKVTEKLMAKPYGGKVDYNNPEFRMMMECSVGGPMRNIIISSGMPAGLFEGMLEMANGKYLHAIKKMIGVR